MKALLIKLRQRIDNQLLANNIQDAAIPTSLKEKLHRSVKLLLQTKETKDKLLVWHAPEVECIGKGKARSPFEFGCKVSITTNVNKAKGGHFILSARAIHGRPYDGHTLKQAIKDKENITGVATARVYVDNGYKGHDYENELIVFKSGQKRGVHGQIKKELKRRSAVEPIIGHAKARHHLGRHRLKGQLGDRVNAIFAAIGFNLRQLLNFIKKLCHVPILLTMILEFLRSKDKYATC